MMMEECRVLCATLVTTAGPTAMMWYGRTTNSVDNNNNTFIYSYQIRTRMKESRYYNITMPHMIINEEC
jgi:hypothetical protein